jgi:hypothetical protein
VIITVNVITSELETDPFSVTIAETRTRIPASLASAGFAVFGVTSSLAHYCLPHRALVVREQ